MPNASFGCACSCVGEFNDPMVPALDQGQELVKAERPALIMQAVRERVKALALQ